MIRQEFEEFYEQTIKPIANRLCEANAGFTFVDNCGALYEEYLNQRCLLKLVIKNERDNPHETLLDRHKVVACMTVAIMRIRLLHSDDVNDDNYYLLTASRINEQLAFLAGINLLISFMMKENPALKESLEDFILPETRYNQESTYTDSIIRALYYSNTVSGFQTLLIANIFFLLEEYHKFSYNGDKNNMTSPQDNK